MLIIYQNILYNVYVARQDTNIIILMTDNKHLKRQELLKTVK